MHRKRLTMHEFSRMVSDQSLLGVYSPWRAARPYSASRILDATQIHRLIAFPSAADVTIYRFTSRAVAAHEGGTNHDSEANVLAAALFTVFRLANQ